MEEGTNPNEPLYLRKLKSIRIYGVRGIDLLGKHIKVYTRGHVNVIVSGVVDDVSENSIVVKTDDGLVVIPVSQIKLMEIKGVDL